jgi:hypothetical protein
VVVEGRFYCSCILTCKVHEFTRNERRDGWVCDLHLQRIELIGSQFRITHTPPPQGIK